MSERFLKPYRILLDHHHVPEFSDPYTCHDSGGEECAIGLEYIYGVVSDRHLRISDVVDSEIGNARRKAIF